MLHVGYRELAERLRHSVPKLTEVDRTFLQDLARRTESRYSMTAFTRIATIAAKSTAIDDREGVAQLARMAMIAQRDDHPYDVPTAFDGETDAQGAFDKAQRKYDRAPSLDHWRAAIAAGRSQVAWTQASLDALYACPPPM